jgi:hypothetical protein
MNYFIDLESMEAPEKCFWNLDLESLEWVKNSLDKESNGEIEKGFDPYFNKNIKKNFIF